MSKHQISRRFVVLFRHVESKTGPVEVHGAVSVGRVPAGYYAQLEPALIQPAIWILVAHKAPLRDKRFLLVKNGLVVAVKGPDGTITRSEAVTWAWNTDSGIVNVRMFVYFVTTANISHS